ncbi:LCCL domain-containing protein [Pararhodobacter zhoushanensis]|uniref:LCCL domain-containing protein n=1 Tax=Pararhodobacter zhoushanensis TaxID=2479545 RepID=A0ABT3GTH6_9RHOB|nr:LCCL domain-containing protein [Pararhodobacter zhoushanensis]MCW1930842.1 LCCL domain-containing protein [Pararhodobacter zhoushanensis]
MTFSFSPFRPATLGLAALIAGGAATSAVACPDWSQSGAPVAYSADEMWVPQSLPVVAGGNVDLSACPIEGHGWVITAPDFDLTVTDNTAGRELEFRVEAECDTVLLVNDATGTWHFNDDDGANLTSRIRLTNAPAGAYDIWVGTFNQATCQAVLVLETFGGTTAPGGAMAPTAPDAPANMTGLRNQVGETLSFTVTGASSGSVWGSDVYTDDSSVARAAVHAGVLQVGETGVVEVTILPGQQTYSGSSANGVQSSNYGSWSGSFSFAGAPAAPSAPMAPANMTGLRSQVGQTLSFTVTGAASGSVWGSGVYTDDSSVARAAVHAGVLQVGETGVVQINILPGQQAYQGSSAHDVQSANYGTWSGSFSFANAAPAAPMPTAPTQGK